VIESLPSGLSVKDNPADVLANNPPFDIQIMNLAAFQNITPYKAQNCLSHLSDFYSLGKAYGSFGLPGDFSSPSRFVKSAYLTALSNSLPEEDVTMSHLFAILGSVSVPKGAVADDQKIHYTLYTSAVDTENMSYSYRTYTSPNVESIYMYKTDLDSSELFEFFL